MTMLVDHTHATKPFDAARDAITAAGEPLNVTVRIQRVDIFDAMHKKFPTHVIFFSNKEWS